MLELIKALCALPGPSGNEDKVRDYIAAAARPFADEIRTDSMGNLIVHKRGAGKRIMLAAHMDEVGLIVRAVTEDGYLKFANVGGIDKRVLPGKRVLVGEKGLRGVIGIKAVHLSRDSKDKLPDASDFYIDIGASSKEEAEKLVSLGDYCVFATRPEEMGGGYIKAKALDDRVGCAVMLELMKRESKNDLWFVFTVQEEVGCRGATVAAYGVDPELAIILEGTTAADIPGVDGTKKICLCGEGVAVPFMDGGTLYDRGLYKEITALAEEKGIKWQTKTYISGGTDAQAIQRSRSGVRAVGLAAPVRNIHSPATVICLSDAEAMLALAKAYIESI